MGWYTTFIAEEYFCKETYNDISSVEEAINKDNDLIEHYKDKISTYAITNPKDYQEEGYKYDETLTEIKQSIKEYLDQIDILTYHRDKLIRLKENFDTRDGDFVTNPNIKEAYKKFYKEHMADSIQWQKEKQKDGQS